MARATHQDRGAADTGAAGVGARLDGTMSWLIAADDDGAGVGGLNIAGALSFIPGRRMLSLFFA